MWPNPQETADLVTFIEEILNGKLHFLCAVWLTVLQYEFLPKDVLIRLLKYSIFRCIFTSVLLSRYSLRWVQPLAHTQSILVM